MPYKHFTSFDRDKLQVMVSQGLKKAEIARELKKNPSSIYRELSLNSTDEEYISGRAHTKSIERRFESKPCPKLNNIELMNVVLEKILKTDAPQQISGRLKVEYPNQPKMQVSTETIYTFVYREIRDGANLKPLLRRGHKKRRKRISGKELRGSIPNRTMIDKRPPIVDSKSRCGDWEGDTVEGAFKQGYIATFVDRNSKFLVGWKLTSKTAESLCKGAKNAFRDIPDAARKTLTLDNGKEFSKHQKLARQLKMDIYFARPYHSWERGLNEHTNGLLRQFFPKTMSFYELTHQALAKAIDTLNNRPRKILGYRTPREVFEERKFALQI